MKLRTGIVIGAALATIFTACTIVTEDKPANSAPTAVSSAAPASTAPEYPPSVPMKVALPDGG